MLNFKLCSNVLCKMIWKHKYGIHMLLGWVSVLLVCLLLCPIGTFSHSEKTPSLLIVSFDGFRWNYLNRTRTPNLNYVIKNGVYAKRGLQNVFTTSTLTNHWSMVTGLFAESHGIVDNNMFDPVLNATYVPLYTDKHAINDPRFYDAGAEPIWVTSQLQKPSSRSGSIQWWGAENVIKATRPTFHLPFDLDMDHKYRIDTMIKWFTSEYPINLGLLYFSEPDHIAHKCGPESENVTNMIGHVDDLTGYLLDKLKEKDLLDDINILITSDHGFAATSRERLIYLDNFVDPSWYRVVRYTPVLSIIPHEGKEDIIYEKLKAASKANHFSVYRKAEIPERLHYKNNVRIAPIIAIADITYSFISRMPKENFTIAGTHGYDNAYEDMHPFFMAMGPSFKENFQVETFQTVDLYPLMCHLLQLHPAPNNGSMSIVSELLYDGHKDAFWTFSTYIACLIVIASVGGVFSVAACRHQRFLRRKLLRLRGALPSRKKQHSLPMMSSVQVPLLSDDEAEDEEF